jgi:hypothetical protein
LQFFGDQMSNVYLAGETVSAVWPSQGWQAFNFVALMSGLLILALIVGNRLGTVKDVLLHPQPDKPSWWARFYLALVCPHAFVSRIYKSQAIFQTFTLSLIFIILAGILQFGIGTTNENICNGSIITCVGSQSLAINVRLTHRDSCILVYGMAKLALYLFLNERAWIVHNSEKKKLKCASLSQCCRVCEQ